MAADARAASEDGRAIQSVLHQHGMLTHGADCDRLAAFGLDRTELLGVLAWWLDNGQYLVESPRWLTLGMFAAQYGYWRAMSRPAVV